MRVNYINPQQHDRAMGSIDAMIAGRHHHTAWKVEEGILNLRPERKNLADRNAISLHFKGYRVGYVPATIAVWLRPLVDMNLIRAHAWHSGKDEISIVIFCNTSWDLHAQTLATFDPVIRECVEKYNALEKIRDRIAKKGSNIDVDDLECIRLAAHDLLDLGDPGTLEKGSVQCPSACAHQLYLSMASAASRNPMIDACEDTPASVCEVTKNEKALAP